MKRGPRKSKNTRYASQPQVFVQRYGKLMLSTAV
jgi:hypothetical protein